mgnify:CR=1|jgi:hypothetical protein
MADFKIGGVTPLLGEIKVGSSDVTRIMNGAVQVWPEVLPPITWYFVVDLIPNGGDLPCNITIVQAVAIVGIDNTNVIVGSTIYKLNGGSPIPLNAGNYRMSAALVNGFTYDINTILVSTYYIEVNQFGTITAKFIC